MSVFYQHQLYFIPYLKHNLALWSLERYTSCLYRTHWPIHLTITKSFGLMFPWTICVSWILSAAWVRNQDDGGNPTSSHLATVTDNFPEWPLPSDAHKDTQIYDTTLYHKMSSPILDPQVWSLKYIISPPNALIDNVVSLTLETCCSHR